MAFGDTQYQVNDLIKRVQQLELQAKASTVRAVPQNPLYASTSIGGTVAGIGVGQDAVSRAATSVVQGALAGVEALQYVLTTGANFNLGAVTTGTIRQEVLRPDPVVGQVYRAILGGSVSRGVAAGYTFTIIVDITGAGTAVPLITFAPALSTTVDFFLQVMFVTTTAGTAGVMAVNSGGIFGNVTVANLAPFTGGDIQALNIGPGNLTGGSLTFSWNTTALSAGSTFGLNCYIMESLGFRTG